MAGTCDGAHKGWLTRRNLYGPTGRTGGKIAKTALFDIGKVMTPRKAPKIKRAQG